MRDFVKNTWTKLDFGFNGLERHKDVLVLKVGGVHTVFGCDMKFSCISDKLYSIYLQIYHCLTFSIPTLTHHLIQTILKIKQVIKVGVR
jgi:hypothetical protein